MIAAADRGPLLLRFQAVFNVDVYYNGSFSHTPSIV